MLTKGASSENTAGFYKPCTSGPEPRHLSGTTLGGREIALCGGAALAMKHCLKCVDPFTDIQHVLR